MHISLLLLTSLAVFFHLGTNIASSLMKDRTDQQKIADLTAKVDHVFGVIAALAPVLPATLPQTLGQGLTDVAAVAGALAPPAPAPNPGGVSTGTTVLTLTSGGKDNAG